MKKLALVLGGGAAKGYAHIGVIKVLEKHGIKPDLIVGTSMGALVGAMYATGKDVQYMEKLVAKFNGIGNFSLISTLFKGNVLNINKVKKIFNQEFSNALQETTQIKFVCVATDMKTGEPKNFTQGLLKDNVMASISIPGIFPSMKIGENVYCDGGLVNNLAEDVAREILPDAVIVSVDVIGEYSKQVEKLKFKTMENLINAITIMTQNVVKNKPILADVRLQLSLPQVSLMNFSSDLAPKTIHKGELLAKKHIEEIKELLGVTNENIRRTKKKSKE
ncbi:MAG: patatin-like phospholipase family protein [Clostridia bacterium]|nr:patatin-like phospholipase family protein [Clostridia bacterium]